MYLGAWQSFDFVTARKKLKGNSKRVGICRGFESIVLEMAEISLQTASSSQSLFSLR